MISRNKKDKEPFNLTAVLLFWAAMTCVGGILFAFTPLTHNLDDIKVLLLHSLGSLLLIAFFLAYSTGRVNLPPTVLLVPLGIHVVNMCLSTMLSGHSWAGFIRTGMFVASMGFFLALSSTISSKRLLIKGLYVYVVFTLATNLFGLIDYFGFFNLLKDTYFFEGSSARSAMPHISGVVITFAGNKAMLSTVLNRDFYGNFLIMVIPFALVIAFVEENPVKRIVAMVTIALSCLCIFFTNSKNTYAALMLLFVLFSVLYHFYAKHKKLQIPHLWVIVAGVVAVVATLVFFNQYEMMGRLKTLSRALASREIIWGGAWKIFLSSPLIGAGPGTFQILFPLYRRADYFEHDISNVTLYSHNYYLDLLCETGIIGFLCIGFFTVCLLYFTLKIMLSSQDSVTRVIAIGFITSVVASMWTVLTSPHNRWPIDVTNQWAVLGLLAGFVTFSLAVLQKKKNIASPGIAPTVSLFLALVLSVILFFNTDYGIRYFRSAAHFSKGHSIRDNADKLLERSRNPKVTNNNPERIQKMLDTADWLYKQAIPSFNKSIKILPCFIRSYYHLAYCYSTQGRDKEALAEYVALQRYAPDYAEIHRNLGNIYRRLGEKEKFVEHFKIATEMEKKYPVLANTANAYHETGFINEFVDLVRKQSNSIPMSSPRKFVSIMDI